MGQLWLQDPSGEFVIFCAFASGLTFFFGGLVVNSWGFIWWWISSVSPREWITMHSSCCFLVLSLPTRMLRAGVGMTVRAWGASYQMPSASWSEEMFSGVFFKEFLWPDSVNLLGQTFLGIDYFLGFRISYSAFQFRSRRMSASPKAATTTPATKWSQRTSCEMRWIVWWASWSWMNIQKGIGKMGEMCWSGSHGVN